MICWRFSNWVCGWHGGVRVPAHANQRELHLQFGSTYRDILLGLVPELRFFDALQNCVGQSPAYVVKQGHSTTNLSDNWGFAWPDLSDAPRPGAQILRG